MKHKERKMAKKDINEEKWNKKELEIKNKVKTKKLNLKIVK